VEGGGGAGTKELSKKGSKNSANRKGNGKGRDSSCRPIKCRIHEKGRHFAEDFLRREKRRMDDPKKKLNEKGERTVEILGTALPKSQLTLPFRSFGGNEYVD